MTMICTTCERYDAPVGVWLCLECHEELERENERLEKALDAACAELAEHSCPYVERETNCWKRWALEKAEQALEGSDK